MSLDKLKKFCKPDVINIVPLLTGNDEYPDVEDRLTALAIKVKENFQEDLNTRARWEKKIEAGLKLAMLDEDDSEKDWPWEGASNLIHPVTAIAVRQFAAYSYPEIVRSDRVLEMQVIGEDREGQKAEKAQRLSKFMNYQLLAESNRWKKELDRLLSMLPAQGVVYKKVYWDDQEQTIRSDVCGYDEVIVNHYEKNLQSSRRITHKMLKHRNDIISRINRGIYEDIELELHKNPTESISTRATEYSERIEDDQYEVLEQHCWEDLDDDGFEEPYIITVLSESNKVLRIAPRFYEKDIKTTKKGKVYDIKPTHYFIDFHYLPSPDGRYHSQSLAGLLLCHNQGINSILNNLVNAGTLATMQGGFFSETCDIKGGQLTLPPGYWIKTKCSAEELERGIKPLEYKEPSSVLFNLLGLLIESAKELSSVNDVMSGKQNAQNVQATTIELLAEKGAKVFSSIQTRINYSHSDEFKAIMALNRHHLDLDKYKAVLDYMGDVTLDDFDSDNYDVIPVSDPNLSSDVQRAKRAEMEISLLSIPEIGASAQAKSIIVKHYLEANNIPNADVILSAFQQQQQPPPDPKMMDIMLKGAKESGKLQLEGDKFHFEREKWQAEQAEKDAKTQLMIAQAQKALAEAGDVGNEGAMQQAQMQLEVLRLQMEGRDVEAQAVMQEQKLHFEREKHNMDMQAKKEEHQMKQQQHSDSLRMQKEQQQMNLEHQSRQQQQDLNFKNNQMNNQMKMDQVNQNRQIQADQYNQSQKIQADRQNQDQQREMDRYKHDSQLNYNREQDTHTREQDLYKHQSKIDFDKEKMKHDNTKPNKPSSSRGTS